MICFKLHNDRNKKAWKNFCKDDMKYVQSDDFESLLEIILEDAERNGEIPTDLLFILRTIRRCMTHFWRDAAIIFPLIARKDITHNRRIIFDIERILFYKQNSPKKDKKGIQFYETIYPILDYYDIFVLLISIYLHDYGKGQFLLIIPELVDENLRNSFRGARNPTDLAELYNILEEYHSFNISQFLQVFLDYRHDLEFKRAFKEKYNNFVISNYVDTIPDFPQQSLPKNFATANAALAQRWLYSILWKLRHSFRPYNNLRPLLEDVQVISRSHKSCKLKLVNSGSITVDFFDTIEQEYQLPPDINQALLPPVLLTIQNYGQSPELERLLLLSALLRIGDNLDFTKERIEEVGQLRETFDNWIRQAAPQSVLNTSYESLFSIWTKFLVVDGVEIRHDIKDGEDEKIETGLNRTTKDIQLEIIIKYKKFTNWQKHLLTIRNMVEKDFQYTNYLRELNRDRVNLRLLFEIVAEESEGVYPIGIEGRLDDIFTKKHIPLIKSSDSYNYQLISPEETNPPSTLEFTPLASDIKLPTNQDLLYLVGFIDTYGTTACDIISKELGISKFENLNQRHDIVARGNVLIVDETNKYVSFNSNAIPRVKKLLAAFSEQPALVRQKIQEIEKFGYLLPFSRREANTIPAGIEGLDGIINPLRQIEKSVSGFRHARNLLVVGSPGTGKTTLLLQILHWNLVKEQRNVLMLTFEELLPVIIKTYKEHFGWNINFIQSLTLSNLSGESLLKDIQSRIEKEQPDLIAIDGLSRLRILFERNHDYRQFVDTLFKSMQIRGISGIYSIEEPSEKDPSEEYQSDGIIHLHKCADRRELEIEKLRSQNYIAGRHVFEIIDMTKLKDYYRCDPSQDPRYLPFRTGINVYPNEQYYASITDMLACTNDDSDNPQYISTGIENLDTLLPGGQKGGYRLGNSILVMGSPGAGKTLFGLHFLKAEFDKLADNTTQEPVAKPCVLWLSFEGPKILLTRSISSFDSSVGFQKLLKSPQFLFEFTPPALISPEKVLYHVSKLLEQLNIKRIVIDSVSEIEESFDSRVGFKQYMTTFIHTLSQQNVTSMFLYRIPSFFHSQSESESEISTLVDTIISIKIFDMKNEMRHGLFILKSRGREQNSKLQTMDIHTNSGISVSYKGWEMEGLLSGETGYIHEPEIFLKLFYENPAEEKINQDIVKEFKRRYADKGRFTEVRKPEIYSEFWSFRGNYGPGHANIRVVSISMYMVEAFRELNRLHELDDFFPEKLKRQIEQDFRWKRYCNERGKHDNIPNYSDMGFLVARRDLANTFLRNSEESDRNTIGKGLFKTKKGSEEIDDFELEIAWLNLKKLSKQNRDMFSLPDGSPCYAFSLPYLYNYTEFMSFFFEILWSKGGDIYHFPILSNPNGKTRMAFYKEQVLLNQAIWEKFIDIIENTTNPIFKIYTIKEIKNRIKPLADIFTKHYDKPVLTEEDENEQSYRSYINDFIKLIRICLINNDVPQFPNNDNDVITINNKFGREALEFIYDLVFDSEDTIPNPYNGDFSDKSIFCRKWYSQIEDLRQKNEICIRALPYFENGGRKKSCATETVWCLSIIKEALSPEIGWIFIDTLTSTEWVKKRAELKRGFPHRFEEVKLMRQYAPAVYEKLQNIVDNKQIKETIYHSKTKLIDPNLTDEKEFQTVMDEFFKGEYHERDIGDVLKYFINNSNLKKRMETFKNALKERGIRIPRIFSNDQNRELVSELSDFEKNLVLRSKIQANRPFFHRVESILHEEIVKLFSPQGRRYWYRTLLTKSDIGRNDDEINRELKNLREKEKKARNKGNDLENGLIKNALQQIHDRLIFDLLTGAPEEIQKIWLMR